MSTYHFQVNFDHESLDLLVGGHYRIYIPNAFLKSFLLQLFCGQKKGKNTLNSGWDDHFCNWIDDVLYTIHPASNEHYLFHKLTKTIITTPMRWSMKNRKSKVEKVIKPNLPV